MKYATTPPPEEWDFRQIDDSALRQAALYEYARSSKTLRPAISDWLETKIEGARVRNHIRAGSIPAHLWPIIIDLGLKATRNDALFHVMEKRPDFPEPWSAFPIKYAHGPFHSRLSCTPMGQVFVHNLEIARKSAEPMRLLEMLAHAYQTSRDQYHLVIRWAGDNGEGVTDQELIADFKKWLRRERRAEDHKTRRGKRSQAPTEPLKWLAAYRLRMAGPTYEQGRAMLDSYLNPGDRTFRNEAERLGVRGIPAAVAHNPPSGKRTVLPIFDHPSGWSDAIRGAKAELERIEA